MNLAELAGRIVDSPPAGSQRIEVRGVACDSRQVRPGDVFVAVPGTHEDGWAYVDDAVRRGAVAVVSEREGVVEKHVVQITVPDTHEALALLAAYVRNNPADRLCMAGVTGTNGKSTTVYMIRDALAAAGRRAGLISTVAYEFGERSIPAGRTTPDAPQLQSLLAQMVHAGCTDAVMEVSSHALVQKRVHGIDYDVAVFTNLTQDHLDYHGDMESYFQAKARLFHALGTGRKAARAVINADSAWGQRLAGMLSANVELVTYGMAETAMVRATEMRLSPAGTRFAVTTPWGPTSVDMRLLGRFNVSNALACLAACGALGVDPGTVSIALGRMQSVRGRLEAIPCRGGFHVFVDYAHTDDALANVLTTLRELTTGRLILVFGCGGNRDTAKRPLMAQAAERYADLTVVTSDNPRKEDPLQIIEQIRQGFTPHARFETVPDRREAIQLALSLARPGDTVLVAGKGHEEFQELANRTIPFDDRQVVREVLKNL